MFGRGPPAYAVVVELGVFDQTSEVIRARAPDHLGELRVRAHRRGVKIWFETDVPNKEHYEAQLLSRHYVDGVDGMALEIGSEAWIEPDLDDPELAFEIAARLVDYLLVIEPARS